MIAGTTEREAVLADPARLRAESVRHHRSGRGWLRWLLAVLALAAGAWEGTRVLSVDSPPVTAPEAPALPTQISALGRLAPEGEVIAVAPPTPTGTLSGARVERLLVAVGEDVTEGQSLAVLDIQASRSAAVTEAKAKVEVAKAKLAQVCTGPKLEEVRVQEAVISRAAADLSAAEDGLNRGQRLAGNRAISKEDLDDRKLKFEQARAALAQSHAQLDALKAIRPVDVRAAEAEVASAEASLEVAETELRNTEVRAPLSGRVLSIRARPGERVGDGGLLEVGNTNVMEAVAEVYEEDVNRVEIGQHASVRVPTLGINLAGMVVSKDLIVSRKVIFSNDPVADIDARVVEVRIRLSREDGARVAGLSNARAEVVIDVGQRTGR